MSRDVQRIRKGLEIRKESMIKIYYMNFFSIRNKPNNVIHRILLYMVLVLSEVRIATLINLAGWLRFTQSFNVYIHQKKILTDSQFY